VSGAMSMRFTRMPAALRVGILVMLVVVAGCSQSSQPSGEASIASFDGADVDTVTVTAVTSAEQRGADPSGIDAPSTPAELEQLLIAYAQCVEKSFPIVIRFRTDPFFGVSTGVSSRLENDPVESVVESCKTELDLDDRTLAYQTANPVTPGEEQATVEEFTACVAGISDWAEGLISDASLDTIGSLADIQDEMYLAVTSDAHIEDLIDVGECYEFALFGVAREFAEGHAWYVSES